MNIEQLSTQLSNISDAVQILARNQITVEHHSTTIDGLVKKNSDYDQRLRDIESLIHQSCDIKAQEFNGYVKDLYTSIKETDKENREFTKYVAGALAVAGAIALGFVWNNDAGQDAKSEKLFNEVSTTLKEVKDSINIMRENLAVLSTNQTHYQEKLDNHIKEAESNENIK